jgi:hypothetical protein|tara:strand:+ start:3442 stop:3618 length:177 start_codon:yes stop_codon:yes gene_type:complete
MKNYCDTGFVGDKPFSAAIVKWLNANSKFGSKISDNNQRHLMALMVRQRPHNINAAEV